ncbi:MAG: pyridine nucleotide-disulfide oxidoreductase family protein [Microbacteriaceae bacterium]|nr:pyridine nucleotide-disulfide oxidoreductase family protein [Microbacteriaceae bacterium]
MARVKFDVVIIGAGKAGSQCAVSLRDEGFAGTIAVFGDEPSIPYDRPPLSKAFLTGVEATEDLVLRAQSVYADQKIDLILDTRVIALDRLNHTLELEGGDEVEFDELVIATGARVRPLPFDGVDLDGVTGLRTIDDAVQLRARLQEADRVVVIGGGFIGLEVAAVAASVFGCTVTLVEALPQLMSRTGLPESAAYVAAHQRALGIDVLLNTPVKGLRGEGGRVAVVVLGDGRELATDVVVYGIGVIPGTDLAESAGLEVANGILVDRTLATSDPHIWAIGDCASYPSVFTAGVVRLESVQNATDQARHVARAIATGKREPYVSVPWFWSDQAEMRIQTAGLTTGFDETVVVGNREDGAFTVLAFLDGRLLGGDSVNASRDHLALRKILGTEPSLWSALLTPLAARAKEFSLREFARNVDSLKASETVL